MDNQPLKICVCGAGTMGSGIAQTCAQHGLQSVLFDIDEKTIKAAKNKINDNLQLLEDRNKINAAQKKDVWSRIQFTTRLNDCVADVIIEAIVEKEEIKAKLFNSLAGINDRSTVFATNTSSLSVTRIAEKISCPERLAGMHFFNPAPLMKLVEVVTTKYASGETIHSITALAERIGKVPVLCRDAPGFIVNHVARPYYLEALFLVEKGLADITAIDTIMESSGFRMGPFRLMDLIGNDINYAVSRIVYEALEKPKRLEPSPIQKEMVEAGQLGRKTGRGYYEYPDRQMHNE